MASTKATQGANGPNGTGGGTTNKPHPNAGSNKKTGAK